MAYLDNDGLSYLWTNKIKPLIAKYLPLTGGTLTGKLKLYGAPTEDMEAATKKYVDDSVAGVIQLKQDVAAITPDDTTVDGKPWTSKKIVDTICQPFEESGNPVQVYPVENYPLGVKVRWEPVQEGSGDPSPDNVRQIKGKDSVTVERFGENLIKFPYSIPAASRNGLVMTSQQDGSITVNGTATKSTYFLIENDIQKRLPMNTPMTLSGCPAGGSIKSYYIGLYLGGKWYSDIGNGNTDIKFTTSEIKSRTEVSIVKGTVCNNLTFYPKIEVGTTITPYSKYQGSTNTLTLQETVYGGEVDAVSGEGQETWKTLTLDGTEAWMKDGDYVYLNKYLLTNDLVPAYSNQYPFYRKYDATKPSTTFMTASENGFLEFGPVDSVRTWIDHLAAQYAAGTPVQVCYKLAEPVPFTATGTQPIPALSGVNTIYTDADSVIVTGAEAPKHTITELKNAIISLGGNI